MHKFNDLTADNLLPLTIGRLQYNYCFLTSHIILTVQIIQKLKKMTKINMIRSNQY